MSHTVDEASCLSGERAASASSTIYARCVPRGLVVRHPELSGGLCPLFKDAHGETRILRIILVAVSHNSKHVHHRALGLSIAFFRRAHEPGHIGVCGDAQVVDVIDATMQLAVQAVHAGGHCHQLQIRTGGHGEQ